MKSINQTHPENESLRLSSVGFRMTPALRAKVEAESDRIEKAYRGIIGIRAKMRFFSNGPRRDTFAMRVRVEQTGPDVVVREEGADLYAVIDRVSKRVRSRLGRMRSRRVKPRQADRLPPFGQASPI
jgi:ribosomal subunit interface protein